MFTKLKPKTQPIYKLACEIIAFENCIPIAFRWHLWIYGIYGFMESTDLNPRSAINSNVDKRVLHSHKSRY